MTLTFEGGSSSSSINRTADSAFGTADAATVAAPPTAAAPPTPAATAWLSAPNWTPRPGRVGLGGRRRGNGVPKMVSGEGHKRLARRQGLGGARECCGGRSGDRRNSLGVGWEIAADLQADADDGKRRSRRTLRGSHLEGGAAEAPLPAFVLLAGMRSGREGATELSGPTPGRRCDEGQVGHIGGAQAMEGARGRGTVVLLGRRWHASQASSRPLSGQRQPRN